MEQISGRLDYLGWQLPWMIGEREVSTLFWDAAESLANKRAAHVYHRDGYMLSADADSPMELRHGGRGTGAGLFNADGSFGFSNVAAYLQWALEALNGRLVTLKTGSDIFQIDAALTEPEPEVMFVRDGGNMGRIADAEVKPRCRPGEADCCIFLVAGAGGFQCAKFSGSTARLLLDRKAKGSIWAQRIGNCRLMGREPE